MEEMLGMNKHILVLALFTKRMVVVKGALTSAFINIL